LSALMDRQVGHMAAGGRPARDRASRGRIELRKSLVELKTVIDAAVETSQPLIEAAPPAQHFLPAEPLNFDTTQRGSRRCSPAC
jgi:hypothetical protein